MPVITEISMDDLRHVKNIIEAQEKGRLIFDPKTKQVVTGTIRDKAIVDIFRLQIGDQMPREPNKDALTLMGWALVGEEPRAPKLGEFYILLGSASHVPRIVECNEEFAPRNGLRWIVEKRAPKKAWRPWTPEEGVGQIINGAHGFIGMIVAWHEGRFWSMGLDDEKTILDGSIAELQDAFGSGVTPEDLLNSPAICRTCRPYLITFSIYRDL